MDTGLNTIEFYSGDISANFATRRTPRANGGAQDNGSSRHVSPATPTGPAQWQMGKGGDGFFARIDPVGKRHVPGEQQQRLGAAARRRLRAPAPPSGATWSTFSGGWSGDQQSFVLPYEIFKGTPGNLDRTPTAPPPAAAT